MSAVTYSAPTNDAFERSRTEMLRVASEVTVPSATTWDDPAGARIGRINLIAREIRRLNEAHLSMVQGLLIEAEYNCGVDLVTSDALQAIRDQYEDEIFSSLRGRVSDLSNEVRENTPSPSPIMDLTGSRFREVFGHSEAAE